jgi:hypothetical protein
MEQQQQWRVFTLTKGRRNKREFVPNKFEKRQLARMWCRNHPGPDYFLLSPEGEVEKFVWNFNK